MRIPSDDDTEFGGARTRDSDLSDVDDLALDQFLERLSDVGRLTLLRWARRNAPDLLHALVVRFLTRASSSELRKTVDKRSWPETSRVEAATKKRVAAATLRAIERQHIARVIAESTTLREAASRLGVACSTLWRRRRLYGLKPAAGSAEEEPVY
jgi:transcriptional regulator with GAF, ATPase, and Fis domain